jgi:hypothetical protein
MKIQLERTLSTCPRHLKCVACSQPFEVGKIRSLLCDRTGLIQGDLCYTCHQLKTKELQQKLRTTEAIHRPQFYEWWFKRAAILSEANQEIEQARFGSLRCNCQKSRQLRIRFQPGDR